MQRDQLFLQWAMQCGFIRQDQAAQCFEARRNQHHVPIEAFVLQVGLLNQQQIYAVLAAMQAGSAGASAIRNSGVSYHASRSAVGPQPQSGSRISNSQASGTTSARSNSGSQSNSRSSSVAKSLRRQTFILEPGEVIGQYTVETEIARGGMGAVYRATNQDNEVVALKVMLVSENPNERELARFQREIDAQSKLDHPNIVSLFESGEDRGRLFYTMELVDGGVFSDLFTDQYSLLDKVEKMLAACEGIAEAHEQKLFHRDLKPANILLSEDGDPKITDFGLVKSLVQDSDLTKSNAVVGTPSYMAPEQVRGEVGKTDQRCDVWALGVIFYELLTGTKPFNGETLPQLYEAILTGQPSSLTEKVPEAKSGLDRIVLRCLEKSPDHRYNNAGELCTDIAIWLEQGKVSVTGQSAITQFSRKLRQGQKRELWLLFAAILAFIALCGGVYWATVYRGYLIESQQIEDANKAVAWLGKVTPNLNEQLATLKASIDQQETTSAVQAASKIDGVIQRWDDVVEKIHKDKRELIWKSEKYADYCKFQANFIDLQLQMAVEFRRHKFDAKRSTGILLTIQPHIEELQFLELRAKLAKQQGHFQIAIDQLKTLLQSDKLTHAKRRFCAAELAQNLLTLSDFDAIQALRKEVKRSANAGLLQFIDEALNEKRAACWRTMKGMSDKAKLTASLQIGPFLGDAIYNLRQLYPNGELPRNLLDMASDALLNAGLVTEFESFSKFASSIKECSFWPRLQLEQQLFSGDSEKIYSSSQLLKGSDFDNNEYHLLLRELCNLLVETSSQSASEFGLKASHWNELTLVKKSNVDHDLAIRCLAELWLACLFNAWLHDDKSGLEELVKSKPSFASKQLLEKWNRLTRSHTTFLDGTLSHAPRAAIPVEHYFYWLFADVSDKRARFDQLKRWTGFHRGLGYRLKRRAQIEYDIFRRHRQEPAATRSAKLTDMALKLAPWDPDVWRIKLALLEAKTGDGSDSFARLALKAFPGAPELVLPALTVLVKSNAEVEDLATLIETHKSEKDYHYWFIKGVVAQNAADHKTAVECLKKALLIDARPRFIRERLIKVAEKLGDAAEVKYQKMVLVAQQDPRGDVARSFSKHASNEYKKGNHKIARETFRKAIDCAPESHASWAERGPFMSDSNTMDHQMLLVCYSRSYSFDLNEFDDAKNPPYVWKKLARIDVLIERAEKKWKQYGTVPEHVCWATVFSRFLELTYPPKKEDLNLLELWALRCLVSEPSNLINHAFISVVRTIRNQPDALVHTKYIEPVFPKASWVLIPQAMQLCRKNQIQEAYDLVTSVTKKGYNIRCVGLFSEFSNLRRTGVWKDYTRK